MHLYALNAAIEREGACVSLKDRRGDRYFAPFRVTEAERDRGQRCETDAKYGVGRARSEDRTCGAGCADDRGGNQRRLDWHREIETDPRPESDRQPQWPALAFRQSVIAPC